MRAAYDSVGAGTPKGPDFPDNLILSVPTNIQKYKTSDRKEEHEDGIGSIYTNDCTFVPGLHERINIYYMAVLSDA
mgnify:FL=1